MILMIRFAVGFFWPNVTKHGVVARPKMAKLTENLIHLPSMRAIHFHTFGMASSATFCSGNDN